MTSVVAPLLTAAPASADSDGELVFQPAVESTNFGTVDEGSSSESRRFVVRNVGSGSSGKIDVDLEGGDDEDFRITSTNCGKSLVRGAGCAVSVAFRPTDDGRLDAKLELDPDNADSISTRLEGTGRARPPAHLVFQPAVESTNFGSVNEDASSESRRFVVRNVGSGSSGKIDVDLEGGDDEDFRITSTNCGKSLVRGAGCAVYIAFRPTDDGSLDARLELDPNRGKAVSTKLVGVGVAESGSSESCERLTSTPPLPASILDLRNWKLTLPVDGCDDNEWADEVTQPTLSSFEHPGAFAGNGAGTGVVFRARVDGARTSSNTRYPRSELREMKDSGKNRASWSNESSGDGVHKMKVDAAITNVPSNKPHVVAAQIHDGSDDVIMIRLNGSKLIVDANDSNTQLLLDDHYVLGTRFTVNITATNRRIRVVYNGTRAVEYQFAGDGMYFKAGCYTLSNTSYDDADAFGKVIIYGLTVSHT